MPRRLHPHVVIAIVGAVVGTLGVGIGLGVATYEFATDGRTLSWSYELSAGMRAVAVGVPAGLIGCAVMVWSLLAVVDCRGRLTVAFKAAGFLFLLAAATVLAVPLMQSAAGYLPSLDVSLPESTPAVLFLAADAGLAGLLAARTESHEAGGRNGHKSTPTTERAGDVGHLGPSAHGWHPDDAASGGPGHETHVATIGPR